MSAYSADVLATTGLVSYWRLGEASGTSAADSKGTNTGTYAGAPALAQTGALFGDTDTAVLLASASSQHVTAAHDASLNLGDTFTVEAWIKRTATQGTLQGILSKGPGAYYLRIGSDDKVHLLRSNIADMALSTSTITDTTSYHHVVATKTGATIGIYIDGVDVTSVTANSTCNDNTALLAIGCDNTLSTGFTAAEHADLYIDEVAVYSVALSAATVLDHYTVGTTAPVPFVRSFNPIPFMR